MHSYSKNDKQKKAEVNKQIEDLKNEMQERHERELSSLKSSNSQSAKPTPPQSKNTSAAPKPKPKQSRAQKRRVSFFSYHFLNFD